MAIITCPHCGAGTFDDSKECIFCGGLLANGTNTAPGARTKEEPVKVEPVRTRMPERPAEMAAGTGTATEAQTPDAAPVNDSTLILRDYGSQHVHAIRIVREATGCGLMEGKHLVDSAPSVILRNADFETCARYFNELERCGCAAEVQSGGRTILSSGTRSSVQSRQPQRNDSTIRSTSGKSVVKKVTTTSKDGVVTRTETWEESSTGDGSSLLGKDLFKDWPFS